MNEVQAFLTAEKFEELKKELEHLKTVRRKEIAEALEYARSLGDLSENAEYQEARDMQAAIEERINYLEKTIKEKGLFKHIMFQPLLGVYAGLLFMDRFNYADLPVPDHSWHCSSCPWPGHPFCAPSSAVPEPSFQMPLSARKRYDVALS